MDLVFLLLAPENAGADHLKALARVARQLRDPEIARKLRELRDAEALYAVLMSTPGKNRMPVGRPSKHDQKSNDIWCKNCSSCPWHAPGGCRTCDRPDPTPVNMAGTTPGHGNVDNRERVFGHSEISERSPSATRCSTHWPSRPRANWSP